MGKKLQPPIIQYRAEWLRRNSLLLKNFKAYKSTDPNKVHYLGWQMIKFNNRIRYNI